MNRRHFLASAAAATATIAAGPSLAAPNDPRIVWETGALENEFAPVVAQWVHECLAKGIVYTSDEVIGMQVELAQPRFVVRTGKKVFDIRTGYGEVEGLEVEIADSGIEIGRVGIVSTHGVDNKFVKQGYFVRAPQFGYASNPAGCKALGDKVRFDQRILDAMRRPTTA